MKWLEHVLTEYKNTIKFLTVLGTIVIVYFGVDQYLDSKIENKITDDSYIAQLSKTLRPFLVFNNDGVVIYDHGGLNFIDSIKINHSDNRWADTIFIFSKSYLQEAPLIQFIGAYLYSYEAKRISNFCWAYDMRPSVYLSLEKSDVDRPTLDNIFTLEVLK
jgi:hypothetical protein